MKLEVNKDVEAAYRIINLLNTFSSNKVLKKYIQDYVTKLAITIDLIEICTSNISQQFEEKICDIKKSISLMNYISIMEVIPSYDHDKIVPLIFPVCFQIFEAFVYQLL